MMIPAGQITLSNRNRIDNARIERLKSNIHSIKEYAKNEDFINRNDYILVTFNVMAWSFFTIHYLMRFLIKENCYNQIDSCLAPMMNDPFYMLFAYFIRSLVNSNKTLEDFIIFAAIFLTIITIPFRNEMGNDLIENYGHTVLNELTPNKVDEALNSQNQDKFDKLDKYAKDTADTMHRRQINFRKVNDYARPLEYAAGSLLIYNTFGPASLAAATVGMTALEASETYSEIKRCIFPNRGGRNY